MIIIIAIICNNLLHFSWILLDVSPEKVALSSSMSISASLDRHSFFYR